MVEADQEIIGLFFDEVEEHIHALNDGLLKLEEMCGQPFETVKDCVDEIFRAFHSIKGASGMLGFQRVNQLTHHGETLLDLIREGKFSTIDKELVQILFEASDGLTVLLDELKTGEETFDLAPIFEKLEKALSYEPKKEAAKNENIQQKTPEANEVKQEKANVTQENNLDIAKYLPIFLDDSAESLEEMENQLVNLDQELTDKKDVSSNVVNELFRHAHKIKGASGAMNFIHLQEFTHLLESLFDRLRSGKITWSAELVSLCLKAVDAIKKHCDQIRETQAEPSDSFAKLLLDFQPYDQSASKESDPEEAEIKLEFDDISLTAEQIQKDLIQFPHTYKIEISLNSENSMSGMRAFMAFSKIESYGQIICSKPEIASLADRTNLSKALCFFISDKEEKHIEKELDIDQVKKVEIQKIEAKTLLDSLKKPEAQKTAKANNLKTMRVDVGRLDKLMNMTGELVISKARLFQIDQQLKYFADQSHLIHRIQNLKDGLNSINKKTMVLLKKNPVLAGQLQTLELEASDTIKRALELKKLKSIYPQYQDTVHQMEIVSDGLQKTVMDIRMTPVGPVFSRFRRVVRDLCRDLGKEVDFKMEGEETELDKKIIDELGDPLTHIVRNAIDHGIELPSLREEKGKSRKGEIILKASSKGNNISIIIQDDGGGLNAEAIKKKAIKNKIHTEESFAKLTDGEIWQLIFHPGFSTAQKVTNISGRGVGMDIVKKKIEELNGVVEISSKKDNGSTFTIMLPLTLAVQKSLLVEVSSQVFAFPLDFIAEIIEVEANDCHEVENQLVTNIRGEIIPIKTFGQIYPHARFADVATKEKKKTLVVLRSHKTSLALIVDQLIGEEDIVIKSLSHNLYDVDGLSGATILGDGRVALIVDVAGVIEKLVNLPLTLDSKGEEASAAPA